MIKSLPFKRLLGSEQLPCSGDSVETGCESQASIPRDPGPYVDSSESYMVM